MDNSEKQLRLKFDSIDDKSLALFSQSMISKPQFNVQSQWRFHDLRFDSGCMGLCSACVFLFVLLSCIGCSNSKNDADSNATDQSAENESAKYFLDREVSPASVKKIESFCGDCHGMPRASSFPITHWRKEVERGFEFYDMSGRHDLETPNLYDTIAYFTQKAESEESFFEKVNEVASSNELNSIFETDKTGTKSQSGIANLVFAKLNLQKDFLISETSGLVSCDMDSGKVNFSEVSDLSRTRELLTAKAPVNATICDIDNDGQTDIVVSDLGRYKATDSTKGAIVLLRANDGQFEKEVLRDNIGRVCQTVVADFDGDGKQDILVGEFGYFSTGSIFLLKRKGTGFRADDFSVQIVDNRHGVVRIVPHDFDGDGDLDFVAAIAQETETIELFINNGKGAFTPNKLFSAEFPSYGTSGIVLVDLDQDGDQDLLYTNGDTFDSSLPKSYHSVQWLEIAAS